MPKGEDVQRVPKGKYKVLTNADVSRKIADDMEAVLNEDGADDAHGIRCLEFKVLVRPKEVAAKTSGGIYLPDTVHEKDQHATTEGVVVNISRTAFTFEVNAPRPELGDTVVFQRYAGLRLTGNDGVEYRLLNDKDVVAVRRSA